jgi:hypothetical protein
MWNTWQGEPDEIGWRHSGELFGYVLWDPFDEILQRLSLEYLREAFDKVACHVQSMGQDPAGLRFGWLHPGVAVVPHGYATPLSYLGWLWIDGVRPDTIEQQAHRSKLLRATSPRFRWASAYRTGVFRCDHTQPHEVLAALSQFGREAEDWDPAWLQEGAANSTLLRRLIPILSARDREAAIRLMEEARESYTPPAMAILQAGVFSWLDGDSCDRAVQPGHLS